MHSLLRAVTASLIAVPSLASAVSLDPRGLGQALIYPYYTVRAVDGDAFNTFLSIVNTTSDPKALRVRFREGRNAREVASFNLFLNAGDMWTGAVVPSGEGAQLLTADASCTSPAFAGSAASALPSMNFTNASYTGANADGAGDGLDRTKEGFVEVIEMAMISALPPLDCDSLRSASTLVSAAPTGGLSGTLTLINVASGMDFTINADALADLASRPFYRPISDPYPDFDAAEVDPVSNGTVAGKAYHAVWNRGVDAVSSVLMTSVLVNEYVLDGATRSRTDWIVTFPTRRYFASGTNLAPPFAVSADPRCASQFIDVPDMYDRESRHPILFDGGDIPPTPAPPTCFRWSTAVFGMTNGSSANAIGPFGSANLPVVPIPILSTFQSGWGAFTFREDAGTGMLVSRPESILLDGATGIATTGPIKFSGLPLLGFMARTFKNGNLACAASVCQGNYGGAFPHRYTRVVGPAS